MRSRDVALTLALLACRGRSPAAVAHDTSQRSPPPHAPTARRCACDELLDEGTRNLDAWRRRSPTAAPETWQDLASFNRCEERARGLWASLLGPPTGDAPRDRPSGRFKLVHIGAEGTRSDAWPAVSELGDHFTLGARETSWTHDGITATHLEPLRFGDLDDDDIAELIATVVTRRGETTHTQMLVWRATATRIEPFEPAMGLHPTAVEDVDGDGRLDLRTHAELVGPDEARSELTLRGPAFVAVALGHGVFSTSSGAALSSNRALCPAAGPPYFVRAGDRIDVEATAHNLACAMAWHIPPAAIDAALTRECPARAGVPASGSCYELLYAARAMMQSTPRIDLRAALSFARDRATRRLRLVVEGVAGLARDALDGGEVPGDCDLVDGDARANEVAVLRCWSGSDGVELRGVRVADVLVAQRRAMHDPPTLLPAAWGELGRIVLPPATTLRAGAWAE